MNSIVEEDISKILNDRNIEFSKFKNKTFLITGATGMIGSYLALTLLQLNRKYFFNIRLILLIRNESKARHIFYEFLNDPNLIFLIQDVTLPISTTYKIDYIIHAASQASPKYYGADPVGTARANLIGTDNLLQLAQQQKIDSFLFLSSGIIYGKVSDENIPLSETDNGTIDPLDVRNCYSESKRAGENICVDYHYQYGINIKIARLFHTLGPYVDLNDNRVFSDICKSFVDNTNIILRSEGKAKRTFLYVVDAVKALFLIITKGENGQAYNIGSQNNEISIRRLVDLLINHYSRKKIKVEYIIDPDSITYSKMKSNIDRIIPETFKLQNLGWKEEFGLKETFSRTIDAISQNL